MPKIKVGDIVEILKSQPNFNKKILVLTEGKKAEVIQSFKGTYTIVHKVKELVDPCENDLWLINDDFVKKVGRRA